MSDHDPLPRPGRGPHPGFSPAEPIAERLTRLFMNLTTEVAVIRERLDTVERLLDGQGSVTRADLEAFSPDEAVEAERRAWRETFVRRVFADLEAEVDAAVQAAGAPPRR